MELSNFMTTANFCRFLFALICAVTVSACQPSYTVDQSVHYARKLGVINQFDINRMYRRAISPSSSVTISSMPSEYVDTELLTQLIAKRFSPHFDFVTPVMEADSMNAALAYSLEQQSDFLMFTSVVDTAYHDKAHSDDYHQLHFLISVIDVNSGRLVEKIELSANSPFWVTKHAQLDGLLAEPLSQVAKDLTGAM